MKFSDFGAGTYLKADDVGEVGRLLTIHHWTVAEFQQKDGSMRPFPVCHFAEQDAKDWVVRPINQGLLKHMFGTEEMDALIGQQIILYKDPTVEMAGQLVGGLRVRAPVPVVSPSPAPPAVASPPAAPAAPVAPPTSQTMQVQPVQARPQVNLAPAAAVPTQHSPPMTPEQAQANLAAYEAEQRAKHVQTPAPQQPGQPQYDERSPPPLDDDAIPF